MKKVSILIPHYQTWRWTAICIWHYRQYGVPVDSEIILVDNSPAHPSIRAITDTLLGDGIKVVTGNPAFSSHGMGYDIAASHANGDWFFTSETDSFPLRFGWFDEYLKASADFDLIGPEVPQSSGTYIHPAGALMNNEIYDAALKWQHQVEDWWFLPGAGLEFKQDKPYHIVSKDNNKLVHECIQRTDAQVWRQAGPYQEMRSFDNDDWETYPQRKGIKNFFAGGNGPYRKIGYEAGQWLSYFAEQHLKRPVLRVPMQLDWMEGKTGQQAKQSLLWGGAFIHVWAGSVTTVAAKDMAPEVVALKRAQQDFYWQRLPMSLRLQIEAMEKRYP